jgi:hypothetical protein
MAKKFYFSSLVRRPMTLSGHVIKFMISSIAGGSAAGVYETENPDEIKVLDDAVRSRRGVSEIDETEFEAQKKRASPTRSSSSSKDTPSRLARPAITPPLSVAEKTAAAPAGAKPAPSQDTLFTGDTHTTPSIASLLRVKVLNPPKPFAEADAKTTKASARAARAKVRVARASVATP